MDRSIDNFQSPITSVELFMKLLSNSVPEPNLPEGVIFFDTIEDGTTNGIFAIRESKIAKMHITALLGS